jgi:hypothetical protein
MEKKYFFLFIFSLVIFAFNSIAQDDKPGIGAVKGILGSGDQITAGIFTAKNTDVKFMEVNDGVGQIGKVLRFIDETRVSFLICSENDPVDIDLSALKETQKRCDDDVPEPGTIFVWLPNQKKQGFSVTSVSSIQEAKAIYAGIRSIDANSLEYPCAKVPYSMIAAAKIAGAMTVTDNPNVGAPSFWYTDNSDEVGIASQVVGALSQQIKISGVPSVDEGACNYLESKDVSALLTWKYGEAVIPASGKFVNAWSVGTLPSSPN